MQKNSHTLLATEFPIPLEEVNALLLAEGFWEGELVHFRRNGEKIVVESRWALFRYADSIPISVLEINRDISDVSDELRLRKHTEQILELQAVITRNIAEGICLVRASNSVFVAIQQDITEQKNLKTNLKHL